MTRIVQKYGGSSVASPDHLHRVAERIIRSCREGHELAVVVSAMGGSTDALLDLARGVSDDPPRRELDLLLASGEQVSSSLLAMALQGLGQPATALTGPQGGIRTRGEHGSAEIREVETERIEKELAQGRVVVVAGFQGEASDGEVTTLGRGGSDTTAVALAAALGAERCQILSDVDGVYTADPRVVPDARRLERISHPEMAEMARHGARVLKEQAVRLAERAGLTIEAGASFCSREGTLVAPPRDDEGRGGDRALGVASRDNLLRVRAARPGGLGALGGELRDALDAHEILHAASDGKGRHLELVAAVETEPDPDHVARLIRREFGPAVEATTELAAVAAIGEAVARVPDAVPRARRALAASGVAPKSVRPGELAVASLVDRREVRQASRALHAEFVEARRALS